LIGYLLDTSGLWHLLRTPVVMAVWADHIAAGALRVCEPTRVEFLYSATGPIDLLVCATAVHHGLTVLHVDGDFVTVADVMPEVRQRDIRA